MQKFEIEIIKILKQIDENSVNISLENKVKTIEDMKNIAKKNGSEIWDKFLESEIAYYQGNYEEALAKNEEAYILDKDMAKKNKRTQNYYIVNSLAVTYYVMRRYKEAEDKYLEAIRLNVDYYQTYIDIAIVYQKMGRYIKAKNKLEYVIKNAEEKKWIYQAKEVMGRLLIEQKKYEDANTILLEIKPFLENDAEYIEALALSYAYLKDYQKAIELYEQAIQICQDDFYINYMDYKMSFLKLISPDKDINSEEELILSLPIERIDVIETVYHKIEQKYALTERYKQQYEKEKNKREERFDENYILCLKGWSSSTPEVALGLKDEIGKKGGGFYIKYNNVGIVIDPGINFLENLHDNNLYIQDIDIVIVTHNHIDHNSDLNKIIDVAYQIDKKIYYYIDKETYKKYQQEFEYNEEKYGDNVIKVYPTREMPFILSSNGNHSLRMKICKTEHKCEGAFGFKIYLENICFGYTSDTGYTEHIGDFFRDVNVVLVNISETNKKDMILQELKETHLGVFGIYKLLEKNETKNNVVCLVAEFFGGFADLRLELADIISTYIGSTKYDIIPVDIGMIYYFDDEAFLCNSCEQKTKKSERSIVRIGTTSKKLLCLCRNCCYQSM